MRKRNFASLALSSITLAIVSVAAPAMAQYEGWTIPPAAKTEKSPFAGSADAVRKGKSVFQSKCQRCHGASGKGDGPEADKQKKPADLTSIKADVNPEGVLFYKVWNGRNGNEKGSMPAFKVQLPKDDVWRAVEYVQTLQK